MMNDLHHFKIGGVILVSETMQHKSFRSFGSDLSKEIFYRDFWGGWFLDMVNCYNVSLTTDSRNQESEPQP